MSRLLLILFLLLCYKNSFAKDIPIIVITPGKTVQSLGTVGSAVTVIDSETIKNSNENFLGNIIGQNSGSTNIFQQGGYGTNMGIQLRGLEKRYSTVYIDGVKMSDPSSPDNSFYFQNIMKDSIERVEVLKGNQSSLYGPNAIGGTIHIFTKKGKPGHRSNAEIRTGSNSTNSIYYSIDGANDKVNYYLGLNRFLTGGISAMNDNGESDQYRNEGLNANVGYKFNDNLKIENSLRYANTDLKYDEVPASSTDINNRTDDIEGSYSLKLIYDKGKHNNNLIYNKTYIEKKVTDASNNYENYFGHRDAINWVNTYNFNLDNRIVYGFDAEFDSARYTGDYAPSATGWTKILKDKPADEHIFSQYFDYQFRPLENLYATFGLRSDEHSTAGRKTSGRSTVAYQLDKNKTLRSSWGTGVRFPALYDLHYADGNTASSGGGTYAGDNYKDLTVEDLSAERANSYDIGFETYLNNLDLVLNIAYFNIEQKNPLNSDSRNNWKMMNTMGVNTTEGVELSLKWKPEDSKIGVDFDYTYSDTYDSNTCETGCVLNSGMRDAKVRVPRNTFLSNITHKTIPGLKNTLTVKYVDETRDFGNSNNSFKDVILEDYITFDLSTSYRIFDSYDMSFYAVNLFDEEYEQAYQYSSMRRSFNIGLRRIF